MTDSCREVSVDRIIALGVVAGVVSAFASAAVLFLIGADLSAGIIGGIAGAGAANVVTTRILRNQKGE